MRRALATCRLRLCDGEREIIVRELPCVFGQGASETRLELAD